MDPKAQFLFFLLAGICFLLDALWHWDAPAPGPTPFYLRPRLLSLGLFFFDVVFLVTAWKAI